MHRIGTHWANGKRDRGSTNGFALFLRPRDTRTAQNLNLAHYPHVGYNRIVLVPQLVALVMLEYIL
jgi:hypothetical protein